MKVYIVYERYAPGSTAVVSVHGTPEGAAAMADDMNAANPAPADGLLKYYVLSELVLA